MPRKTPEQKAEKAKKQSRSALKRQFKRFDKDGSGTIEGSELKSFVRSLNISQDPETRKAFYKIYDANKDKSLSFAAFEVALEKATNKVAAKEAELQASFDSFDKDKSGFIEAGELRAVVKHLAEQSQIKSRKTVLAEFDSNQDGKLSFKEFRALVKHAERNAKRQKMAKKLFVAFDTDKSGKIEPSEFENFLHAIALATSGAQRLELTKACSSQGAGFTEAEFVEVFKVCASAAQARMKQVKKVFKAADKDGSGELSRKELGQVLPKLGIEVDGKTLKAMMKAADADGDGTLDLSEFKELMYQLQTSP